MAASERITITLQLDDQGAVSGIRSVNDEVETLGTEGASQAQSFGDTMSVALGNLAADAAMQLAERMGQLISQGYNLVQQGADIRETQSKFNTVFQDSSETVQQFIRDRAQMMGLTERQAQELLASAGAQAQAMGFAREESAKFSEEVSRLAGDLASFNNADPQQAFQAITSALNGERERLKQFDIQIKESMVQTRALAMTSKENADALTQQEKALASLKLMYEKAGPAVGDLERTSESAANTGRQAAAAWGDVRDEFAKRLLPVASDLNQELLELAESEDVMETVRTAAEELAEQLTTAIELGSGFVQVFAENSDEVKAGAELIGLLTAGVTSYVAATKLQVLWTKRAVIWQKAATIAQRGLNAALRANPIGLVAGALAMVIPLFYRFQDRITDAAASVLDFSAKTIRGLQGVVQWFRDLLRGIPGALAQSVPGLQQFRALVEGAGAAVETSADQIEGWAESLRKTGEETEEHTVQMGENKNQVDFNTESVEENTEAVNENAQARKEAADAPPPVPPPEAEEPKNQVIEPDVSFDMESLISGAESAEQVLRAGLIQSINEADAAIRELQDAYDSATTKPARQEIQAMIDKLRGHRDEMEATKKELLDLGPALEKGIEDSLTAFAEGIGEMMAGAASVEDVGKQVLKTLAGLAERVGKMLIGFGVGGESLKAMVKNPATAIAAGAALVALASAAKSAISSEVGGDGQPRGSDEAPRTANVPSMRSGGRVEEGQPVLVGDGPGGRITPYSELFVPETSGTIVPRSQMNVTRGAKRQGGQGQLEEKLDEVARRFEEKQFRLRGNDLETSRKRTQAELQDAGI